MAIHAKRVALIEYTFTHIPWSCMGRNVLAGAQKTFQYSNVEFKCFALYGLIKYRCSHDSTRIKCELYEHVNKQERNIKNNLRTTYLNKNKSRGILQYLY